jgi:hypothetical protein
VHSARRSENEGAPGRSGWLSLTLFIVDEIGYLPALGRGKSAEI